MGIRSGLNGRLKENQFKAENCDKKCIEETKMWLFRVFPLNYKVCDQQQTQPASFKLQKFLWKLMLDKLKLMRTDSLKMLKRFMIRFTLWLTETEKMSCIYWIWCNFL